MFTERSGPLLCGAKRGKGGHSAPGAPLAEGFGFRVHQDVPLPPIDPSTRSQPPRASQRFLRVTSRGLNPYFILSTVVECQHSAGRSKCNQSQLLPPRPPSFLINETLKSQALDSWIRSFGAPPRVGLGALNAWHTGRSVCLPLLSVSSPQLSQVDVLYQTQISQVSRLRFRFLV